MCSLKMNNENRRAFWRAFIITLILLSAVIFTFLGSAKAYAAVRKNAFGESTAAVEIINDENGRYVRIFDYVIGRDE